MSPRQELRSVVLLCLAGSGLVLLAASRAWLSYRLPEAPPLPASTERVTGALLLPGARPLALVGLAGVAALFAARRNGRLVVGVLVLAAGTGVVILDLRLLLDRVASVGRLQAARQVPVVGSPGLGPWPWVCLVGGLLLAVSGSLVAVRGRRWAALSSAYEAPGAKAVDPPSVSTDRGAWDALDRGEDPTG